jgi:large repetitive protein
MVAVSALSATACNEGCTLNITTPDPLPDGRVGQVYSLQMQEGRDCLKGRGWSLLGGPNAVPPGLAISGGGMLSGTPARAGTYTLQIATDAHNHVIIAQAERSYTLTILPD